MRDLEQPASAQVRRVRTDTEVDRLDTLPAGSPRAGQRQIEEVLAYVPAVARRYNGCGLDFDERVAAGNLGLVKAALSFDPSRKVKFITYASWWIRKAILEALEQQLGPVRLPRYQHEKLRVLRAARDDCRTRLGDEPSDEQLSQAAGLSLHDTGLLLRFVSSPLSLEQPLAPGDDRPVKDLLPDPATDCPQDNLVRRELARRLRRKLASLERRARQVLTLRFGLDGARPLTLREAGRRLGLSRERVRQIELRALLELRRLV